MPCKRFFRVFSSRGLAVFYRGGEGGVDVMVRRECAKEAVGADELRGSDAGHEGVRGKMRGDAAKFRMSGKDLAQDLFILFGLEGTGGIDEAAARRETGQRRREERNLAAMKVREVGGLESPADFRIARESAGAGDRKSTRLNSSHPSISYAVF